MIANFCNRKLLIGFPDHKHLSSWNWIWIIEWPRFWEQLESEHSCLSPHRWPNYAIGERLSLQPACHCDVLLHGVLGLSKEETKVWQTFTAGHCIFLIPALFSELECPHQLFSIQQNSTKNKSDEGGTGYFPKTGERTAECGWMGCGQCVAVTSLQSVQALILSWIILKLPPWTRKWDLWWRLSNSFFVSGLIQTILVGHIHKYWKCAFCHQCVWSVCLWSSGVNCYVFEWSKMELSDMDTMDDTCDWLENQFFWQIVCFLQVSISSWALGNSGNSKFSVCIVQNSRADRIVPLKEAKRLVSTARKTHMAFTAGWFGAVFTFIVRRLLTQSPYLELRHERKVSDFCTGLS